MLLVTLLVVLATTPGLAAAESRTGGSVIIEEGETVDGLEAFAGSVVVRGTVDGDLSAAAGDVTIAETGRVTGDVSAAAGSVSVRGTVDGDVSGAAGDVNVAEGGSVGGNVEVGAGTVRIDGNVAGDVTAGADTIILGPTASIGGDLTYDGQLRGDRSVVAGTVERDSSLGAPAAGGGLPVVEWAFGLYGFVVNLVLGAVLLLVFPVFSRRVAARAVDSPVLAGGVGLLGLIAVPLALVALALTIVGIPFTIVGAVLFAVLAWVAGIYGRFAVGTWLLSYTESESRWMALLAGFLAVAVLVRVPLVGWVADLAVFLLGFGALVLLANDRRRTRRSVAQGVEEGDARPA